MSDTKESMPAQPKTVELPKVDVASMLTTLAADMKQVLNATDKMSGDVDMLISDGRKTNQRLTRVEERLDDFDGRLMRTSARVKEPSQHDLEAQRALADEIAARETLAKQVEALTASQAEQTKMISEVKSAVVGVVMHPKVIFVGKVIFGLAVAYSAAHGLKVVP